MLHQRIARHLVVGAVTGLHQQIPKVLQRLVRLAQFRFALCNHITLSPQHTLVVFRAGNARARSLGLRRSHWVITGTQHALASCRLLHQIHKTALARAQVVDGAVIHIGSANAVDAHLASPALMG